MHGRAAPEDDDLLEFSDTVRTRLRTVPAVACDKYVIRKIKSFDGDLEIEYIKECWQAILMLVPLYGNSVLM
jgi:hypothetical protein